MRIIILIQKKCTRNNNVKDSDIDLYKSNNT